MSTEGTIGGRLRSERKRLGYNIRDFALIGGVGKSTQSNYENDVFPPDSGYLNKISALGAEIFWIMSGSKEDDAVREKRAALYPPDVRAFIDDYLLCPEAVKNSLRAIAAESAAHTRQAAVDWKEKQGEE